MFMTKADAGSNFVKGSDEKMRINSIRIFLRCIYSTFEITYLFNFRGEGERIEHPKPPYVHRWFVIVQKSKNYRKLD